MYEIPFSENVAITSGGCVEIVAPESINLDDWPAICAASLLVREVSRIEDDRAERIFDVLPFHFEDWCGYAVLAHKFIEHEYTSPERARKKSPRDVFNSERTKTFVRMIDSGVPYVCAHADCEEARGLEIDHIVPLSKGGTNDLSNLQFLCRTHNARKGARVPVAA